MRKKTLLDTRHKKIRLLVVVAFMLSNFIFMLPAFASNSLTTSPQTPSGTHSSHLLCLPLPLPLPLCTPTPQATPSSTPTVQISPIPTITVPVMPTQVGSATPTPAQTGTATITATPTSTPTVTPTPTSTIPAPPGSTDPIPAMSASGSFTLTASKIVGTNARLDKTDLGHPILSFSTVSIQDMKLAYISITLSAAGSVFGSGAAIKTSVFQEFITALGSFTDKADLLILLAGGTVPTLMMTNVTLKVDRYINMQSTTINDLTVS